MAERVLMKGNEAIAEAAIQAGCRHYFGYPITPQTEIAAYMAKKMPKIGGVFLQAESEIASINMVYGAAAAGMRVMTSSSSPGISLKGEGLSYIAGSDVPAFVVNVQRGGPGLGGIQPSQSDYFQATRGGGHGDYHMIVADGTIGQMMEPISFEDVVVEHYDKPWALTGTECKRKHNIVNSLYLQPEVLERKNFERYEKYKVVEENEAMAETYLMDDADVGVVAFGIAARVAKNAVVAARAEGIRAGLVRPITLWPFPKAVLSAAADQVKSFVSVELNMGQMIEDIQLATACRRPVSLCNRVGGMIPSPDQVLESIRKAAKGEM